MAASHRQLNWSTVGFTPTSGTLTSITGVQEVQVDPGGELLTYSGDNDRMPTLIVAAMSNPKVEITTADTAVIQGFALGTVGVVTATALDAKGATGGNIVYTISNAVVENTAAGGSHGEIGEGTISFLCFSSDGTTSPIAFART